jgi:hypothetical protein
MIITFYYMNGTVDDFKIWKDTSVDAAENYVISKNTDEYEECVFKSENGSITFCFKGDPLGTMHDMGELDAAYAIIYNVEIQENGQILRENTNMKNSEKIKEPGISGAVLQLLTTVDTNTREPLQETLIINGVVIASTVACTEQSELLIDIGHKLVIALNAAMYMANVEKIPEEIIRTDLIQERIIEFKESTKLENKS